MRHLVYEWKLKPETYGFDATTWPNAGEPFSIFTSQYGSGGKTLRNPISTLPQPTDDWSRKQIAHPPSVSADQFVVINSFGSTPGVLPLPVRENGCRTYRLAFVLSVNVFPGLGSITQLTYNGGDGVIILPLSDPSGSGDGFFSNAGQLTTMLDDAYSDFSASSTVVRTVVGNFYIYTCHIDFTLYGTNQPKPVITVKYRAAESPFNLFGSQEKSATITSSCVATIDFIEDIKPNGFINIGVNDTHYFQDPTGLAIYGISGDAAPYPRNVGFKVPQYDLYPNIYILPGQTWDFEYTIMNDVHALNDYLIYISGGAGPEPPAEFGTYWTMARVFICYWLFEGSEALICQKLLKLGISIHPDSVDWYKRQILESEGMETDTYEKYLDLMREWKEVEKQRELAYHRKRGQRIRTR